MSDKLTIVRDGVDGGAGYYVNGELYNYALPDDFTLDVEDIYQDIMLNYSITEIETEVMSEEDFNAFAKNNMSFFVKLSKYSFSKGELK